MQEVFSETQLSISPAGGFVAYESSELGYPEIFVRSFPDLGGRRMLSTLDIGPMSGITNSDPREARSPLWSVDGSEILIDERCAVAGPAPCAGVCGVETGAVTATGGLFNVQLGGGNVCDGIPS